MQKNAEYLRFAKAGAANRTRTYKRRRLALQAKLPDSLPQITHSFQDNFFRFQDAFMHANIELSLDQKFGNLKFIFFVVHRKQVEPTIAVPKQDLFTK